MNVPSVFHFTFFLREVRTPAWRRWIGRTQQFPLPRVPSRQAAGKNSSSNLLGLTEAELKEQFVRGDGPGGQATNKTNNCVVLKHIPSGIVVKVIIFYFITSVTNCIMSSKSPCLGKPIHSANVMEEKFISTVKVSARSSFGHQ